MTGRLYGIGVGPGDPDLLTIKAINTIRNCDIIAVPESGSSEHVAHSIVKKHITGKELLLCRFTMEHNIEKRKASRQAVANSIIDCLKSGKTVGFITLGDPTTYSTFMYIHNLITREGYLSEIIPGISSYSAAAATLGIALCEGNEMLTICAGHSSDIDELMEHPGTKIIMKSGHALTRVLERLNDRGVGNNVKIISCVTMADQQIFHSIDEYEKSPETGYFTLAIVKEE